MTANLQQAGNRSKGWRARCVTGAVILSIAGCAMDDHPRSPRLTAAEGRALIAKLIPANVSDRTGWATDMYAAMAAMEVPATVENFCAAIAITEQESGFRADPAVPGLSAIAWKEIERQRERAGVPRLVVQTALALPSPNGKSYTARLEEVKTERQLSAIFEDFIGMVPLAKNFLSDRNPVRTGGPMQVSVSFAESHVERRPYPYALDDTVRHEVFSRRGGVYFGIAHLFDYPANYDSLIYRYADFNAGWYASRNAAFQQAVTTVSGVPLALDGDLLRYEQGRVVKDAGATERALRVLGRRLDMNAADIRRDLERGRTHGFEETRLYRRVFGLADEVSGAAVPRAVLPRIDLQSPKFTRKLTTDWFARRVDERQRRCVARAQDLT